MASASASTRDVQRQATRERIYSVAVDEIARRGIASADIGAIAVGAGVARGTFYFHFPSREHVLVELERREELRMVAALERRRGDGGLRALLGAVVAGVRSAERRLGATLFRDMLSVHFGAAPLAGDALGEHPLAMLLVEHMSPAPNGDSELRAGLDPAAATAVFLTGLFGLLVTGPPGSRERYALVDVFTETFLEGAEAR